MSTSLEDVKDAALRIQGHVRQTPLLESALLNEELGFRLLLKAECLQVTGSFKARGAFNQLLQLTEAEKTSGVVAISSGNHAQAVAYVARELEIRAAIVMPSDAPRLKMKNTRSYGAEIVIYDRDTEDREAVGERLLAERGGRFIHPYNDPRTAAGQGTVGLEIFEQTTERGIVPDALIVNCCGGGLAAGIAVTRDLYKQPPLFYVAEPEEFDDAQRSLASSVLCSNAKKTGSICDALLAPHMGEGNFEILRRHHATGLTATDEEVEAAMTIAAEHFKIVLEPSGAVGFAAAIRNRARFKGQTVVVVGSGGNVDAAHYAEHLEHGERNRGRLLALAKTPFVSARPAA